MELEGKSVAILVEQMYEDMELLYPMVRLREAGAKVSLVGPEKGKSYPSKHGQPAVADLAADDVSVTEFDALVIPGGYAPDHMRRSVAMVDLVRQFVTHGKITAVICHGPWMLCSANVLQGRHVTSFPSIKDDVVHAGANWVDEEVVEDDNLITSRHPGDLPAFMRSLIRALSAAHVTA